MTKKVNPFLAQFEAKLEAQYSAKLKINSELDMLAMLLMMADDVQLGPGRAPKCLNDFLAWKMEIAERVLEEGKDDDEILVLKRDLASKMKDIFKEHWDDVKSWFPLLQLYW